MQYSSGLPAWFEAAFANAGDRNTIPATTTVTGAAALNTGWPSICSLPEEAGGIAPTREDLNGILYWLSNAIQRLQAGGFMPYNATFATAIGGYPKGAFVRKADGTGYWMNEADSNTTDPDGGSPANWTDAGIASGNAVLLNGNQTVNDIKTFTSSPVVPDATEANQAAAFGQLFGVGMSSYNVTASRSLGTTYTNSSPRLKIIILGVHDNGVGITPSFVLDGQTYSFGADLADRGVVTLTIPLLPGSSFNMGSSGCTLSFWCEIY